MRKLPFILLIFIAGIAHGQDKVYQTYKTDLGTGIRLISENLDPDQDGVWVTDEFYDFIDYINIPENTRGISKMYFRYSDNGKMGILNVKGKIMIPAIFDTIARNYKLTGIEEQLLQDFYLFKNNGKVWVQRADNLKRLFPESYDSIHYDIFTGDLTCYNDSLVVYYCNNGKQLFPNIEFEAIYDVYSESYSGAYKAPLKILAKEPGKAASVYAKAGTFTNSENADLHEFVLEIENYRTKTMVLASKNGKKGLLDETGNIRIPFLYDNLIPRYISTNKKPLNRLIIVENGKIGLCDFNGNVLYPPTLLPGAFTENEVYYDHSLFIVSRDTATFQGVVDANGIAIIPIQEQTIEVVIHNGPYAQHYFTVTRNGKKGIYDFDGKEVIPCNFYDIYDENSSKNSEKAPKFITFRTFQEYSDYWDR